MIIFRVRRCTRRMWTMLLPCSKLIGLFLFCLHTLLSVLFLNLTQGHKTFSRTELARPVIGTIFLVIGRAKRAPYWGVQSRFCVIFVGQLYIYRMSNQLHRQNYVDQTRTCSKSSRAALAWIKKKYSLRKMRNLKQTELRILKNRGKKG